MIESDMLELGCPVFNHPPSEKDFQLEVTEYLNKNLEDLQTPQASLNFKFTLYVTSTTST